MKIIANTLTLPQQCHSVVDIITSSTDSTKEQAEYTVSNTGITHLRLCNTPSSWEFLSKAADHLSPAFKDVLANVDALIVVTQSYDNRIPNLSSRLQAHLELPQTTFCLDMIDGCNGFVRALKVADSILEPEQKALIVAGDINTKMTGQSELGTKVLFGDGYGFTIVQREEAAQKSLIRTDGSKGQFIETVEGDRVLQMNGFEVFRFTHTEAPKLVKQASWIEDDDTPSLYALHQASALVVKQIAKRLSISDQTPELFNCGQIGNLGAGSIPAWIANAEIGPDHQGTSLHCVAYGAGLSWGIATVELSLVENGVNYVDV